MHSRHIVEDIQKLQSKCSRFAKSYGEQQKKQQQPKLTIWESELSSFAAFFLKLFHYNHYYYCRIWGPSTKANHSKCTYNIAVMGPDRYGINDVSWTIFDFITIHNLEFAYWNICESLRMKLRTAAQPNERLWMLAGIADNN